ncbi:MAG TPA: hypothetical protein VF143_09930 [Candidatus Nanopelagicales bacterium]
MSKDGVLGDRFLEILAVVLLGLATVGTAWCGLQASLWNGDQGELANAAGVQRIEASRLFGLATQTIAYDASTIEAYAGAVLDGDERAQEFYRTSLMRPGLLPFLEQWQAQMQSGGTPPNLITDPEYLAALQGDYQAAEAKSQELGAQAEEAGRTGDSYILTTVLLAVALFFAGVTSSFRYPIVRTALLTGSVLAIASATARLIDLPIAAGTGALIPWL